MRFRAIIVTFIGLAVALATITATYTLSTATDSTASPAVIEIITSGQIHQLFTLEQTWAAFPAFPPVRYLLDAPAAWVMFVFVVISLYVVRYKLKGSFSTVGLWCLFGSFVPYVMGATALAGHAAVGPWSHTMLASVLYGSMACVLFGGLNFFKVQAVRSKYLQQLEKNKELLRKKAA